MPTKIERAKAAQKLFMKRTCQFKSNYTRILNEQAFGKDKKKWPDHRLSLPYTLDYLRTILNEIVGMRKCRYCGVIITAKNMSLDHCIPIKRRCEFPHILEAFVPSDAPTGWQNIPGAVDWGYLLAAFNVQNTDLCCCIKCNRQKGEMCAVDFAKLVEALGFMTPKSAQYVRRQLGLKAHWHGKSSEV